MLSKNNKILIGCLALLLVMSVGYALFSDTIEINGSATAQGEFELTTTCDMNLSDANMKNKGSVTDAKISCEGNVVNASATLDYPGSEKWFRVMVKNTGTIPAKLSSVVELNDPDNMYFSKEEGYLGSGIENCAGNYKTNYACSRLYSSVTWVDDYTTTDENSFDPGWDEAQFDAVLDPGETAYFFVQMDWDSSSTTPGEPLTSSLNAQITWEQVTE